MLNAFHPVLFRIQLTAQGSITLETTEDARKADTSAEGRLPVLYILYVQLTESSTVTNVSSFT